MNTRCTLGKPNMGKTQLEGEAYALALFFLVMKCKYKERGTHYGVSMDIVANMVATRSSTSSILLQYPTPKCSTQLWNNNNTIRMEPLPFLVA
jgi:hypothetical protein